MAKRKCDSGEPQRLKDQINSEEFIVEDSYGLSDFICELFGKKIRKGTLAWLKGQATNHLFYVNVRTDVFSLRLVV